MKVRRSECGVTSGIGSRPAARRSALASFAAESKKRFRTLEGLSRLPALVPGLDADGFSPEGRLAVMRPLPVDWYNPRHVEQLEKQDVDEWNATRPSAIALYEANIPGRNLAGRDLVRADLRLADLRNVDLRGANLEGAVMRGAKLVDADLRGANLTGADLGPAELEDADGGFIRPPASLRGARLAGCNLRSARLFRADLTYCQLVGVNLSNADLSRAQVYGVASWDLDLTGARQQDLSITREDQGYFTVDTLDLAQFIYLLIERPRMRDVLDTISLKTVLILGRFSETRKEYLDLVSNAVRAQGNIPLVVDFKKPASTDLTGTVETLARLARFVVADLSEPRSVPHELATVVPFLRTTPVLPLLDSRSFTYAMFEDLRRYPWVLEPHTYESAPNLSTLLPGALATAQSEALTLKKEAT